MKIDPLIPIETEITGDFSEEAQAADEKLSAVIEEIINSGEPPLVDAYGDPLSE